MLLPFPMASPWSPFSPTSLTVPCPAFPPQLVPWIVLVPPTPGRTPGCKVVHPQKPGATLQELQLPTMWAVHSTLGWCCTAFPCAILGDLDRQKPGSDPAEKCGAAELGSATFKMRG